MDPSQLRCWSFLSGAVQVVTCAGLCLYRVLVSTHLFLAANSNRYLPFSFIRPFPKRPMFVGNSWNPEPVFALKSPKTTTTCLRLMLLTACSSSAYKTSLSLGFSLLFVSVGAYPHMWEVTTVLKCGDLRSGAPRTHLRKHGGEAENCECLWSWIWRNCTNVCTFKINYRVHLFCSLSEKPNTTPLLRNSKERGWN